MFGNVGDMMGMIKKAKELQSNFKKVQSEMASVEASAKSPEGLVEVTAKGDFTISRISISPDAIDKNDPELLEGLILETVNNALVNVKAKYQAEVSKLTGGINIPGLF